MSEEVKNTFGVPFPGAAVKKAAPAPTEEDAPAAAPPPPEDLKARMARVREERAKRDQKYREADELRTLEFHELLLKYEDKYGRRGERFDLVDAKEYGFVVLARGEAVLWKSYLPKMMKDKVPTDEEVLAFVGPQVVYPERRKFDEIVSEVPAVARVCANVLAELFGVKERDDRGK